jgi:hypothetical protein
VVDGRGGCTSRSMFFFSIVRGKIHLSYHHAIDAFLKLKVTIARINTHKARLILYT